MFLSGEIDKPISLLLAVSLMFKARQRLLDATDDELPIRHTVSTPVSSFHN